jgi:ribosomal protein S18 acetylase RimI-like enzyme
MPPAIRRYEPRDREVIWELHNQALNAVGAHGGNGPWDDDLHHVEEIYLRGGEFLVVEVGGRVVAMGALRAAGDGVGEIKRMRVHPDFQRRGLGRAVLARLERRASELGIRTLRLDTTTRQLAARGLYGANGYVEVGRTVHGPFEVILLEKRLPDGGESRGEP